MGERGETVVVLVVVAVFFGGYLLGSQQSGSASEHRADTSPQVAYHHHGTIEFAGDIAVPRVDLVIHKDTMAGRNLEIITENFRFAPEHAGSEHVDGEGHAHLYIDGKKIARVYGPWFHIPEPGPGMHSVRVTLNANSHQDFVVGNQVIEDTETFTVVER